MATPGELVRTMATVLGIPLPTVTQYDRHLAEAGLRQIRGRGTSAAKVSAEDAANLLIAILGSPAVGGSIRTAAETSKRYGSLVVGGHRDASRFAAYGLTTLSQVPETHNFKDALVALIDGASLGDIIVIDDPASEDNSDLLEIGVTVPYFDAEIIFLNDTEHPPRLNYISPELYEQVPRPDLLQYRIVTFRTIRALGSLISGTRGRI